MTHDEFRKQLEHATKIVESWPKWKQNILEHSASPTVSVPREPVCNYDLDGQRIRELEAENYRLKQQIKELEAAKGVAGETMS